MTFAILFIPPLLLGTLLLWRGLRGRRVDDHPICRNCGFDLFGRPEGSDVCPECGADLRPARAIEIGRRERRRALVGGGVLLLGIALTLAVAATWATLGAADWQKRKPAWWLVREIASADTSLAAAAAKELSARLAASKLSQRYIDDVADKLLAIQANKNATWDPAFGDFIEDARLANKLDDPRFHRYALAAPAFSLEVRPRINRGDELPFWIREGKALVGSRQTLRVQYLTSYRIDSVEIEKRGGLGGSETLMTHGGGATGTKLQKHLDRLPDGRHTAEVLMHLAFHLDNAPPGSKPFAWTRSLLSAPFDIVPADAPTVEIVRDESLRPAIEAAVTVENVHYGQDMLDLSVQVRSAPIDIGFDVFAVVNGKEHEVGYIAEEGKPNANSGRHMSVQLRGLSGDKIDFVFKPSVAAAKRTTDTFGIWDGVIVKRDNPVKRATAPATTRVVQATAG